MRQYKDSLLNYIYRSYLDTDVKNSLLNIHGHLIQFPKDFLRQEATLSPILFGKMVLSSVDHWAAQFLAFQVATACPWSKSFIFP